MGRASKLLERISLLEDDWVLLKYHYPKDVERLVELLKSGPPRESEKTTHNLVEDPPVSSDSRSARDLVWNFASKFEYMTAMQASARLDVVMGLLTEKLGTPAPQPEGPAPLSELRQDSAPMLQLRRDVRWLDDRGFRGQTRVSDFSLAEMTGLTLSEFGCLSLTTRQKFENRAYTALRTLNGGGR